MNTLLHTIVAGILAVGSFLGIYHAPVSQINPDNAVPLGAYNPTGGGTYRLQSSVSSSATTITLSSFKEPVSLIPYTMSYLNSSIEYATLEPQSSTKEFISFTGITQNSDGSATLTGVTRGLGFSYPYTASTTLQQAHPAQAILILSNPPQLTNQYVNKNNDETITGTLSVPEPTSASNVATKNYVDTHVNGGTVSTDHVSVAGVAGETITAGQVLYFKSSDQRWYKATITDGNASTTQLGIAQGAGTAGNAISGGVTTHGLDTNQSGMSLGSTYYVGATAGTISSTKSGRVIGQAKTATNLYFDTTFDGNPRWGGFNFTVPSQIGASSTVLATDGSGNLTWNTYPMYLPTSSFTSSTVTSSTTVAKATLPANAIGSNGVLHVKGYGTWYSPPSTGSMSYIDIGFGSGTTTAIFDCSLTACNTSGVNARLYFDYILKGNGATNSQKGNIFTSVASSTSATINGALVFGSSSPSVDTTVSQPIYVIANALNTNKLSFDSIIMEILR